MTRVALPTRILGRTGMTVSAIGLGAGPLGDLTLSDHDAERVLASAWEAGITVLDTAPSYGASEDRIGRFFASHPRARDAFTLVTKGGYGVEGVGDWTPDVIHRGVAQALARLRTDRLDAFLFHSCPPRDDLLDAMIAERESGRVRAIGYSGDGEGLAWASATEAFDVIECSVSFVDQAALRESIPRAIAGKKGVFAKRSLANAAWAKDDHPYTPRVRTMFPLPPALPFDELAVRFAAHAPGVSCALVGTQSAARITRAAELAAKGPLDFEMQKTVEQLFALHGLSWPGLI